MYVWICINIKNVYFLKVDLSLESIDIYTYVYRIWETKNKENMFWRYIDDYNVHWNKLINEWMKQQLVSTDF